MVQNISNQKSPTKKALGNLTAAQTINSFYHVKLTILVSLLAWPVTYIFNNVILQIDQTARPFWMMAAGFIILFAVAGGVAKYSYVHNWMYYGSVLFAFTAVIDLIITLEFNGLLHNFMSEYLKLGEPYLASSWGSAIALFDGIGFYFMYLLLVHLISNGKAWRSLGIYYGAAIVNSMIVLMLAVAVGKHSPTFCTFLNVPYILYPISLLAKAFIWETRPPWRTTNRSLPGIALDITLAISLGLCAAIVVGKGVIALTSEKNKSIDFLSVLVQEPSLLLGDPAPFAALQAIVQLFYILPLQAASIFCLLTGWTPPCLWESSLIHAGIMMQSQFSVIGQALDPQTPPNFRSNWLDGYFWFYNLILMIIPHIVLIRLSRKQCKRILQSESYARKTK